MQTTGAGPVTTALGFWDLQAQAVSHLDSLRARDLANTAYRGLTGVYKAQSTKWHLNS